MNKKYTFTNSKGHTKNLNGNMKLSELVKIGVIGISIVPKDAPKPKDPSIYWEDNSHE